MKILRMNLQKAKDNTKNKIEGYPTVEQENTRISPFQFVNSSATLQHLYGFQETRWENNQNIFNWITLRLRRIIIEIIGASANAKETSFSQKKLASSAPFLFWLASGQKSHWNMTVNQKTANHKYCFSTNQRKKQNLVFEHLIRQVDSSMSLPH